MACALVRIDTLTPNAIITLLPFTRLFRNRQLLTMIIDLASLGASPKQIQVSFAPGEIDIDDDADLESDVALEAEVSRVGSKTYIKAAVKADASIKCSRCLEPVRMGFDLEFQDVFVDADEESSRDETEIAPEALDESLLIGHEIDLIEVVREQMLLAVPVQVFCNEDCKGLCPICGGNRNLIDCNCEKNEIDPRWAALKNLN